MSPSNPPEGNRNAVLVFHFAEGDDRSASETRVHLEGCAECREYLGVLGQVEEALRGWSDDVPPAGLCDLVLAQVQQSAQEEVRPLRPEGALPLLALLPAIAALVGLTRWVAAALATCSYWPWLAQWPGVVEIGPWGVTALLTFVVGGLGSLALAPALVMEGRRRGRLAAAW